MTLRFLKVLEDQLTNIDKSREVKGENKNIIKENPIAMSDHKTATIVKNKIIQTTLNNLWFILLTKSKKNKNMYIMPIDLNT